MDADRLLADRLITDLDAQQVAAVTTPSALVAVIAPAGSGKTRVLTRRIAHRVAIETADARHTLALTFTREAAGELRRRLRHSGLREPVEAGTFHSVALALLRQRWLDLDRRPPAIVNDPERLLGEAIAASTVDVPVQVATTERGWAAARGVAPEYYVAAARAAGRRPGAPLQQIANVLTGYAELKRHRGVIDLDDLLGLLTAEMTSDRAFATAIRWRFRHVLVDEAQDLNPVQQAMLEAICGERRDLFLVGDPAQAIYGFNGADAALLGDADQHLPGVEIVRLRSNHRCTPQIVFGAAHVLSASGQPAQSVSTRDDGTPIEFAATDDERNEAEAVATIIRTCSPSLLRDGAVAVLARTNEQLQLLGGALDRAGVPRQRNPLAGGSPLTAAVRTAAALPSASRLRAWAHDVIDLPPTAGTERSPAELAEHQVATAVIEFLREAPLGDGAGFRAWVATSRPFAGPDDHRGVELLTFHGAKGREWHTVVVTGVETGLVPHRSATTGDAKAEEARLLHVAMTRASDRLVLTRARRRRGYQREASPFVAGLVEAQRQREGDARRFVAPPGELSVRGAADPGRERAARLELWRRQAALATARLPAQVCSDDDLSAIAATPPSSADELAELIGIGPATAAAMFPPIRAALDEPPD